jgi:hypothetical protein
MNPTFTQEINLLVHSVESGMSSVSSQLFQEMLLRMLRALLKHSEEGTDFVSLSPEFRKLVDTLENTNLYSFRPSSPKEKLYPSDDPQAELGYPARRRRDSLPTFDR